MALALRQKLTIITLCLYWPALFILSHIPIPQIVYEARVSDKSLHVLAYLLLFFLLWFALRPKSKIRWNQKTIWLTLSIVIVYGALDEVIQGYVGRSCDLQDFYADMVGVTIGLIVFTLFNFWVSFLAVTAITIFMLTNLAKANLADLVPATNFMFHLFGYALLTAVWIRNINLYLMLKSEKAKWIITILILPITWLGVVKGYSVFAGREFSKYDIVCALAGIGVVTVVNYFSQRSRSHLSYKLSPRL